MRLTIPRDALEPALKLALGAADPKADFGPYARLLLEAATGKGDDPGRLLVAATDGDASLRVAVPAEVTARGAALVDARTLRTAVKLLPEHGQVALTMERARGGAARLRVSCDRALYRLESLPPEDFPLIALTDIVTAFEIEGTALARAMALCAPAMSSEETRFYLNGVRVHEDAEGDLVFVATDGHKLVRVAVAMPEGAGGFPGIILPRLAVTEVTTLARSVASDPVKVELSETLARFTAGPLVYTTKLVDGTYPDYERAVPDVWKTRTAVDPAALRLAIARARVVVEGKGGAVRLEIGREESDDIAVSASGFHGDAADTAAATLEGPPLVAGFNGVFLGELLALMPAAETAHLHFVDDQAPCRLTSDALDGVTMVLMPMRIGTSPRPDAPDDLVPADQTEGAEA